eukprot:scaffold4.g4981.t1
MLGHRCAARAATLTASTFTLRLAPGRETCGTSQGKAGFLTAPTCGKSSVGLYKDIVTVGRQKWNLVPVAGGNNLLGGPVLVKVNDRAACGQFATYPKSCQGAVTLAPRTAGNAAQHWVVVPIGNSWSLRPALCPNALLSFQSACGLTNVLLLPKGTKGALPWFKLARATVPPPPSPKPPSPSPAPTPTPASTLQCTIPTTPHQVAVTFSVDSEWNANFQGSFKIQNNNNYPVLGWELSFDFSGSFTWGPDADVQRDGTRVTLTPKGYGSAPPPLLPGATLTLQFGATGGKPTSVRFTQVLPPIASASDLSLAKRGSFGAKVFSPFVDAVAYPTPQLLGGPYNATGQLFYTLAFIIAQTMGTTVIPSWGGVIPLCNWHFYDQIRAVRLKGGDVIISFGGAAGTELAQAITDLKTLVKAYQAVIDVYRLRWIDFDVEGGAVADPPSVDRRNKALAQLKAANPGLTISYTLPVLPAGLTLDGENLLRNAKANGFNPDVINVMAMDYGDSAAPSPDGRMGTYALWAAGNTSRQAKEAGLTSKIGLTPMIGKNDVESEVFRLPDAEQVARFAAETPWMRWTAFWSVNRDNWDGNTHVSPSASSIPQEPYAFTKKFKTCT